MDSVLRQPPEIPEWRRSGRFFAVAIALHLAVLAYPAQCFIRQMETPPAHLMVRLVAAASPPLPAPVASVLPQPATRSAPTRGSPVSRRPARVTRPLEAAAAAPVAFAMPAAQEPAPADKAGADASPVLSPPHFNAAYLHNPAPLFPPMSRRLGEEGKVLLRVKVSPEGQPLAVDIEKGSNFERLDQAARDAVGRWRFVPARRGEQSVEGTVIVPIAFRLDE